MDLNQLKNKVIVKYPKMRELVESTKFKVNNKISTAATDGSKVYFNESFMNSLKPEEQTFIVVHEMCHILFNHIKRRKGKNPTLWNVATDAVINANLAKDGLPIVEGGIDRPEAVDMDAEEFYQILLDEYKNDESHDVDNLENDSDKKSNDNNSSEDMSSNEENNDVSDEKDQNDSSNDNDSQDKQSEVSSYDSNVSEEDQKDSPDYSNQNDNKNESQTESKENDSSEPQSSNGASDENSEVDNASEKESSDLNNSDENEKKSSIDEQSVSDETEEELIDTQEQEDVSKKENIENLDTDEKLKELEDHSNHHEMWGQGEEYDETEEETDTVKEGDFFKENHQTKKEMLNELKKAMQESMKGFGEGKGKRDLEVKDIGKGAEMIDWQRLLKKFERVDIDWSYNNASIEDGVVTPHLEEHPKSDTEIVLDTSGSIPITLLVNFLRECKNVLNSSTLKVGCFDYRFYGFKEIRNEKDIDKMVFEGGGGTDFSAAIDAFSGRVDNMIIFTDGEAYMPYTTKKIIWIVFGGAKINPNAGQVIYITDEQLDKLLGRDDDNLYDDGSYGMFGSRRRF